MAFVCKYMRIHSTLIILTVLLLSSCGSDPIVDEGRDLRHISYEPTDYIPIIPDSFPILEQNPDNLMTVEGIALGRDLFFDPIGKSAPPIPSGRPDGASELPPGLEPYSRLHEADMMAENS